MKPGKSKTIIKRTFQPDDELKIKNTGAVPLVVCLSVAKKQPCENGVSVPGNSQVIIKTSELGGVTKNKFLTLTNPGEQEGGCVITLL